MFSARDIEEAILKRDMLLSRVAAGERGKLLAVLEKLTKSLAAQMYELDDLSMMPPSRRMRVIKKFIKDGEKVIGETISGYGKEFNATLAELIVIEASHVGELLSRAESAAVAASTASATGGTVNLMKQGKLTLTAEQAEMLLKDSWIANKTVSEMLDGQEAAFVNEFKKRVRRGYVSGQTNQQIARELKGYVDKDGIIHPGLDGVTGKNAERIVRTSCLAMANTARLEMYRKNSDGILCIRWLAALDLRTCIECAELDGKYWDLDGNPIGHEIPFVPPPAHYNCRCTLVPVTSLDAELDENGNVVDKRTPLSTRASKDGQVPATWSFEKWFDSLSEEEQERYLGTSRFTLMKSGEISFSDLVNKKGKIKTILELGHPEMPDDLPPQNQPAPKKSRRKRKPQEQQTNSSA